MTKHSFSILAILFAALSQPIAGMAQTSLNLVRATNLARMEAERLNGGLSKYFAANCMHQRDGGNCLVESGPNGFVFQFLGGAPGWQVNKQDATVETRIQISADGTKVLKVDYNGSPR